MRPSKYQNCITITKYCANMMECIYDKITITEYEFFFLRRYYYYPPIQIKIDVFHFRRSITLRADNDTRPFLLYAYRNIRRIATIVMKLPL